MFIAVLIIIWFNACLHYTSNICFRYTCIVYAWVYVFSLNSENECSYVSNTSVTEMYIVVFRL